MIDPAVGIGAERDAARATRDHLPVWLVLLVVGGDERLAGLAARRVGQGRGGQRVAVGADEGVADTAHEWQRSCGKRDGARLSRSPGSRGVRCVVRQALRGAASAGARDRRGNAQHIAILRTCPGRGKGKVDEVGGEVVCRERLRKGQRPAHLRRVVGGSCGGERVGATPAAEGGTGIRSGSEREGLALAIVGAACASKRHGLRVDGERAADPGAVAGRPETHRLHAHEIGGVDAHRGKRRGLRQGARARRYGDGLARGEGAGGVGTPARKRMHRARQCLRAGWNIDGVGGSERPVERGGRDRIRAVHDHGESSGEGIHHDRRIEEPIEATKGVEIAARVSVPLSERDARGNALHDDAAGLGESGRAVVHDRAVIVGSEIARVDAGVVVVGERRVHAGEVDRHPAQDVAALLLVVEAHRVPQFMDQPTHVAVACAGDQLAAADAPDGREAGSGRVVGIEVEGHVVGLRGTRHRARETGQLLVERHDRGRHAVVGIELDDVRHLEEPGACLLPAAGGGA